MNSWNGASSYAVKVKIWDFVPRDLQDKAFELLEVPATFYPINAAISTWGKGHNYVWQARFNGRSSGYLVLYSGGSKKSEWKSFCQECGQRNFQSVTAGGNQCGVCHEKARVDYAPDQIPLEIFSYPGKGVDQGEDFSEWSPYAIRERVRLVKDFDKLAERCKKIFLDMCRTCEVKEEEILVPKKVKRLICK